MTDILIQLFCSSFESLYQQKPDPKQVNIQKTKADFKGDFTINVFPYLKISRKSPPVTAAELGQKMQDSSDIISSFEVIQGFLNLSLSDKIYMDIISGIIKNGGPVVVPAEKVKKFVVEFSSPNTNKPLHLGHVRNNLLGHSICELLKAAGHDVVKVNLVNDRGIHICKSMLAWQKWGNGITPESAGKKGDKVVGDMYVKFDKMLKIDIENLYQIVKQEVLFNLPKEERQNQELFTKAILNGIHKYLILSKKITFEESRNLDADKLNEYLSNIDISLDGDNSIIKKVLSVIENKKDIDVSTHNEDKILGLIIDSVKSVVPLYNEALEMLKKWEEGDAEVRNLWTTMNGWVYAGFDETYKNLGIGFDKIYHESETYILGKEIVADGVTREVFKVYPDNSVRIDMTADGLDEKVLLRSDGTSVYITQDLGTAVMRQKEFQADQMVYVVGNEQNYHFQVLKLLLSKLGYEWAEGVHHLSYGMVELPEGKMKSREGTVVDADDLMAEMITTAREVSEESGKLAELPEDEKKSVHRMIGLGALKYFILKVDPKKNMLFDPRESIEFEGNTGPFIQYARARINSVLRRTKEAGVDINVMPSSQILPDDSEKELIKLFASYSDVVGQAASEMNPGLLANYLFALAKSYNQFYHDHPILRETDLDKQLFRIHISSITAETLKNGMRLLGIDMPERM